MAYVNIYSNFAYTSSNQLRRLTCSEIYPPKLSERFGGLFIRGVFIFSGVMHMYIGLGVSAVLSIYGIHLTTVDLLLIAFGSLLPDIDSRYSLLGRFNLINRLRWVKHRGKCHTIIGSILLCVPFYLFGGLSPFLFVWTGCMSHLLSDKLYSYGKKKKAFTIRMW